MSFDIVIIKYLLGRYFFALKVYFYCLKLLKLLHYNHRIIMKGEYYDW